MVIQLTTENDRYLKLGRVQYSPNHLLTYTTTAACVQKRGQ